MRRAALLALIVAAGSWGSAQEATRFFAAATSSPGADTTFLKTDGRVFNPDATTAITVQLAVVAANVDDSAATEVSITVGPRPAAARDDQQSYLYLEVAGDPSNSGSRMPRSGGPLSQPQVDLHRSRIASGAPDN